MKQIINLYIFKENSQSLLKQACQHFAEAQKIEAGFKILRTASQKPYISNHSFYISKSNTPQAIFFACSSMPCSIDFQEEREVDLQRLAQRFFLEDEIHYLINKPDAFFYKIWCAKECVIKYKGGNIEDLISKFSTLPYILNEHKDLKFKYLTLNNKIHGGILSEEPIILKTYNISSSGLIRSVDLFSSLNE